MHGWSRWLRMPRRARSTFRAEIREGDSLGTWMELSSSASVAASVSAADASLELLMQNLRCFDANLMVMEFENAKPSFRVGIGKLFWAIYTVEVEEDTAIGITKAFLCLQNGAGWVFVLVGDKAPPLCFSAKQLLSAKMFLLSGYSLIF